jgi:predicted nucleic acid-binding Zn finger protein
MLFWHHYGAHQLYMINVVTKLNQVCKEIFGDKEVKEMNKYQIENVSTIDVKQTLKRKLLQYYGKQQLLELALVAQEMVDGCNHDTRSQGLC